MSEQPHWSMRPGGHDLTVTRIEVYAEPSDYPECSCGDGKVHVKAAWPIHGWAAHSGQCCDCLNIRVYQNGAQPDDWDSGDSARIEYAQENSEEIHICDIPSFIEMLQAIRAMQLHPEASVGRRVGPTATTTPETRARP